MLGGWLLSNETGAYVCPFCCDDFICLIAMAETCQPRLATFDAVCHNVSTALQVRNKKSGNYTRCELSLFVAHRRSAVIRPSVQQSSGLVSNIFNLYEGLSSSSVTKPQSRFFLLKLAVECECLQVFTRAFVSVQQWNIKMPNRQIQDELSIEKGRFRFRKA